MRSAIAINAEQPHPSCLSCHWWTRNKQAKAAECVKSLGRQVTDCSLERTRIAYPRTLSSETCEEHTPKFEGQ